MSVYEDLGFSAPSAEGLRKPATPQHRWKLIAKTFGVSRHRCEWCCTVKTVNHADRVTRYARGHTISALAPPCQSVHVEQIP